MASRSSVVRKQVEQTHTVVRQIEKDYARFASLGTHYKHKHDELLRVYHALAKVWFLWKSKVCSSPGIIDDLQRMIDQNKDKLLSDAQIEAYVKRQQEIMADFEKTQVALDKEFGPGNELFNGLSSEQQDELRAMDRQAKENDLEAAKIENMVVSTNDPPRMDETHQRNNELARAYGNFNAPRVVADMLGNHDDIPLVETKIRFPEEIEDDEESTGKHFHLDVPDDGSYGELHVPITMADARRILQPVHGRGGSGDGKRGGGTNFDDEKSLILGRSLTPIDQLYELMWCDIRRRAQPFPVIPTLYGVTRLNITDNDSAKYFLGDDGATKESAQFIVYRNRVVEAEPPPVGQLVRTDGPSAADSHPGAALGTTYLRALYLCAANVTTVPASAWYNDPRSAENIEVSRDDWLAHFRLSRRTTAGAAEAQVATSTPSAKAAKSFLDCWYTAISSDAGYLSWITRLGSCAGTADAVQRGCSWTGAIDAIQALRPIERRIQQLLFDAGHTRISPFTRDAPFDTKPSKACEEFVGLLQMNAALSELAKMHGVRRASAAAAHDDLAEFESAYSDAAAARTPTAAAARTPTAAAARTPTAAVPAAAVPAAAAAALGRIRDDETDYLSSSSSHSSGGEGELTAGIEAWINALRIPLLHQWSKECSGATLEQFMRDQLYLRTYAVPHQLEWTFIEGVLDIACKYKQTYFLSLLLSNLGVAQPLLSTDDPAYQQQITWIKRKKDSYTIHDLVCGVVTPLQVARIFVYTHIFNTVPARRVDMVHQIKQTLASIRHPKYVGFLLNSKLTDGSRFLAPDYLVSSSADVQCIEITDKAFQIYRRSLFHVNDWPDMPDVSGNSFSLMHDCVRYVYATWCGDAVTFGAGEDALLDAIAPYCTNDKTEYRQDIDDLIFARNDIGAPSSSALGTPPSSSAFRASAPGALPSSAFRASDASDPIIGTEQYVRSNTDHLMHIGKVVSKIEHDDYQTPLAIGDLIRTLFRVGGVGGKQKWYPGKITQVREGSSETLYTVQYDDGDVSDDRRRDLLTKSQPGEAEMLNQLHIVRLIQTPAPPLDISDNITADAYRGVIRMWLREEGKWVEGEMRSRAEGGDTFTVVFNDSDGSSERTRLIPSCRGEAARLNKLIENDYKEDLYTIYLDNGEIVDVPMHVIDSRRESTPQPGERVKIYMPTNCMCGKNGKYHAASGDDGAWSRDAGHWPRTDVDFKNGTVKDHFENSNNYRVDLDDGGSDYYDERQLIKIPVQFSIDMQAYGSMGFGFGAGYAKLFVGIDAETWWSGVEFIGDWGLKAQQVEWMEKRGIKYSKYIEIQEANASTKTREITVSGISNLNNVVLKGGVESDFNRQTGIMRVDYRRQMGKQADIYKLDISMGGKLYEVPEIGKVMQTGEAKTLYEILTEAATCGGGRHNRRKRKQINPRRSRRPQRSQRRLQHSLRRQRHSRRRPQRSRRR